MLTKANKELANLKKFELHKLTTKRLGKGEVNLIPACGFSKTASSRERVRSWFFVTFNTIISYIFPENFIEIPLVVQKIRRFSPSILTIFINFSDFLTLPCYKEITDISI